VNQHALRVIELDQVLDVVAAGAISEVGAERIRALTPSSDREWIEREHARIAAMRAVRSSDDAWRPERVPDIRPAIARLRITGLAWSAPELLQALHVLRGSRRTRDALSNDKLPAAGRAMLAPLVQRLVVEKQLEAALAKVVNDDGQVRDEASPELRRIRRELRASEGELVRLLERALERLDPQHRVPDMSVTMRNGRFVIPVRRDGGARLGGIVHDASASGATLFVEPPAAVEFGNRMRELEAEERDEVDRILRETTELVRPHRDAIADTGDALAELDALHARAAYADVHASVSPAFVNPGDAWGVAHGRHPLLLTQNREVVPFDLDMAAGERTIVISGPNTGGKTVLLKAVALTCAMAQSGLPPACGGGSRLPIFDDYFADIGDEQSIEASLSTFSAHVRNLAEIVRKATPQSLVLIDELGSGTDPLEGAALGWAILEELTQRGTTTLATSHLGALKELPTQVSGVVNASLHFDAERMMPTYRFVKGIPGRSFGISIARRLELPEHVVARAEERVPSSEREVAALAERLEEQQAELRRREEELNALLEDARGRVQDAVKRERNVREREREVERRSRQEARTYLLNARAEIERTVRDLKRAGAEELDEKARDARRHAEDLAKRQGDILEQLDVEESKAQRRRDAQRLRSGDLPQIGDTVRAEKLDGKSGRVVDVRGSEAVVAFGSVKMTLPVTQLERVDASEIEKAVAWHADLPEPHVRSEVDVRGMRVDEVDSAVLQALDDAIRADLPALRIIHGKGTGALRARVTEMLAKDTRVRQFRLGAWNEGGAGVTVAELG
jgi:DNA mismatch repair protein MutS2